MTSQITPRKRFRLQPLEKRNVPGGVLLHSGLLDGMIALGATFGEERSEQTRRIDSRRIATRRQDRLAMPAWADEFLDQLQRELEQTEIAAGREVHATDVDQPSRLDELMAKVDRQLAERGESPVTDDAMPGWAEDFLGQIHRDLDRTSCTEASAAISSDQTTVDFKEPMPEWAEDLLSEVREEVAHWCAH